MGPTKRIHLLRSAPIRPRILDRFIQDPTMGNLAIQMRGALPTMTSALRRYADLCELRKVPPCPVADEAALQWRSMFNNAATFGNYVSPHGGWCFFLRYPTRWRALP